MRYGMRLLTSWAVLALVALSTTFSLIAFILAGHPALLLLMVYLMAAFFCVGILFGNLNSLAMEPLGHIAGVGAAVVGSLSTLLAVPLGTLVGQGYNGTVLPLVGGFAILSLLALLVMSWAERKFTVAKSES
jgi:DHA1 family bicyclomycin/chloramphenicol resistance-like MFS transporter